ncbi:unnamed protein product [Ambrosiozyma monospora]|uniref:Unnamed protein product n=1 Tax=Ambrosiozyma monospora TaxID=43982 RepID=A0A9W6T740_AMBMO|nr:unnamed protein product [Ambrosiozyma monospora]
MDICSNKASSNLTGPDYITTTELSGFADFELNNFPLNYGNGISSPFEFNGAGCAAGAHETDQNDMVGKETILDNARLITGPSSSSSDDPYHEASSSTSSTSLTTTETMDPLYTPTTVIGVKTEVPILPTSIPPSTIFKKNYLSGEKRHREENDDFDKIISTSNNSIVNSDIEFYPPSVKRRSTSSISGPSPKTRSYSVGMFPPFPCRNNSINNNIMSTTENNSSGNNAPKVLKKDKRKSAHTPYDARYWSKRNSQVKSSFDEEAPPSWRMPSLSSTHDELFETSSILFS